MASDDVEENDVMKRLNNNDGEGVHRIGCTEKNILAPFNPSSDQIQIKACEIFHLNEDDGKYTCKYILCRAKPH